MLNAFRICSTSLKTSLIDLLCTSAAGLKAADLALVFTQDTIETLTHEVETNEMSRTPSNQTDNLVTYCAKENVFLTMLIKVEHKQIKTITKNSAAVESGSVRVKA